MIAHKLDTTYSILHVRPKTSLEQGDFKPIAKTLIHIFKKGGNLSGLIIEAPEFPERSCFRAVVTLFRFVGEHRKHIKKAGLLTDSALGNIATHLTTHFVSTKIKHFSGNVWRYPDIGFLTFPDSLDNQSRQTEKMIHNIF
jgi:hypothetical protein